MSGDHRGRHRSGGRCPNGSLCLPLAPWFRRIVNGAGLFLIAFLLLFGGFSRPLAQEVWDGQSAPDKAAYTVRIKGIDDSSLEKLLEQSSQLIEFAKGPKPTPAGLRRRIETDEDRFQRVLRSEGYYDARISSDVRRKGNRDVVTITVEQGLRYRLRQFDVMVLGGAADARPAVPSTGALNLNLGSDASAQKILGAEKAVVTYYADRGHPFAEIVDRKVIVDHRNQSVLVKVGLDPGPASVFGETRIVGLEGVTEDYVRSLIPWSPGDPYDQSKVDRLRQRLVGSRLFSTVVTQRDDDRAPDGSVGVTIQVFEGPARSIGFGAKYSTDEGFAGALNWENRNIFGNNEDLTFSLDVGQITQEGSVELRVPDRGAIDQDIVTSLSLKHTNSEAFNEVTASGSAGIRRPLGERWNAALDATGEFSHVEDQTSENEALLASLPGALLYDSRDSLARPTRGQRLRIKAAPYAGRFNGPTAFFVSEIEGSTYFALDDDRRFVLAGRAKVGSLIGEKTKNIPANKRFYAGGDQSVRGYKFQTVGPLDENDDPLGGRSLVEVGGELRAIVWRSIGIVPFVDGGMVFERNYPDFSEELRWAAGVGVRHHTLFGPVRLDVAFPLNRRDGVDDAFQFYISVGQTF